MVSPSAMAYSQSFYGSTCNNCSASQRANSAIYQGVGYKYVADFNLGTLYKYQVSREPKMGGGYMYFADAVSVEADHIDAFHRAKAIWDSNGHSLSYTKVVPLAQSGSLTAFDVVDPGVGRTAVVNYISSWSNWGAGDTVLFNIQSYGNAFLAFRTGQAVTVTVQVNFPDGSKADFVFSYANNSWAYVDKSSVDSHGNPIPQSSNDIVRTPGGTQIYDYSGPGNPYDLDSALDRFTRLGVPMGAAIRWACVTAGGATRCTAVL